MARFITLLTVMSIPTCVMRLFPRLLKSPGCGLDIVCMGFDMLTFARLIAILIHPFGPSQLSAVLTRQPQNGYKLLQRFFRLFAGPLPSCLSLSFYYRFVPDIIPNFLIPSHCKLHKNSKAANLSAMLPAPPLHTQHCRQQS